MSFVAIQSCISEGLEQLLGQPRGMGRTEHVLQFGKFLLDCHHRFGLKYEVCSWQTSGASKLHPSAICYDVLWYYWYVMRSDWAKAQLVSECPGCLSSALHDLLRPSERLAPSRWTPGGSLWRQSHFDPSKPGDSELVIAAWMFLIFGFLMSYLWFLVSSWGAHKSIQIMGVWYCRVCRG